MSESPLPRRSPVHRLLAPGLAMVAVAGVTAGAVVLAHHRSSGGAGSAGTPPPLRLADAYAAGAPELPVGYGPPTVVGPLPAGPDRAAVRTLPAGAAPKAVVEALARTLGLTGTPARTDHGWQLTDGGRTLQVADTAGMPWLFGPKAGSGGGAASCHVITADRRPVCPPVVVVPPQPAPQGGGGSAPGGAGSGTGPSGTAGEPGVVGIPEPGAPADDSGNVSSNDSGMGTSGGSGNAAGNPAAPDQPTSGPGVPAPGKPLPLPVPGRPVPVEPLPLPTRPTDADALTAAKPVLAAVGLADADTRVLRIPGQVSVLADPVVDGLPTSGFETSLAVAPGGTITSGNGWLARPATGAEYPLVSAAEAIRQVPVPGIARLCGTKACTPRSPEITGAALGLALRWEETGKPLLVPAWHYRVRGQDAPIVVVAVQPAYLGGRSQPPNAPGGAPMPVDPSGSYQTGGGVPGQVEPAPAGTR